MIVECPENTRLQDHLLRQDIHILTACGGRGNCGKCRVRVVEGEAPAALKDLPAPDVVFVGGSGGRLESILDAAQVANPHVRICVTAIALETLELARRWMGEHGFDVEVTQLAVSRTRQSGSHHLLLANNPVFLVVGTRAVEEMRP